MQVKASQICARFTEIGVIDSITGPDRVVTGIASVETCGTGDLVFVDKAEFVESAIKASPAAIVTTHDLAERFGGVEDTSLLSTKNVRLASALLRQAYVDRNYHDSEWGRVHSSAVIHETAVVPEDAVIGPGVVLGRGVIVGHESVIMANAVVEEDAVIGDETVVHPNVTVGYGCKVGARNILKSGCVIGMEGFGFAQDEKRKSHRIPQLGIVVLGDDVVIGANCNIDRATFGETRIGSGTKLDALCHIAHNVEIGEDCLLTAQTVIAGSTRLGKRIICSGQTGILDHLSLCDDVVLVQRAGVISDITEPGIYAGLPVQPMKEYFRNTALARKAGELKKRVGALEKQVASLLEEKHR